MRFWLCILASVCIGLVACDELHTLDSGLPWPGVIQFQNKGVIHFPDLISEFLQDERFQPGFERASKQAQINFNVFALEWKNCTDLITDAVRSSIEAGATAVNACAERPSKKDLPFYQLLNLHELDPFMREMALSMQLAALAADLLQRSSVRLYQTALFRKDPKASMTKDISNQPTSYHRDLNNMPLDTNHLLTFWCPLMDLKPDDSKLVYALESHLDITHFFWFGGEADLSGRLRHTLVQYPNLKRGDCVAHHGNLLHAASRQQNLERVREAIAFTYVDAEARKLPADKDRPKGVTIFEADGTTEDQFSFLRWFPHVEHGAVIDHPSLPLVWPPDEEAKKKDPRLRSLQGPIDTEDAYEETAPDEAWSGPDDATVVSNTLKELFRNEL